MSNYIEKEKKKKKNYDENDENRKNKRLFDQDKIFIKIKIKVIDSYINALSSYKEFKEEKIDKNGLGSLNKDATPDFNLDLLQMPLIRVLKNNQKYNERIKKNKKNNERIKIIIDCDDEVERNSINTIVNLNFQNCLDIFRYKEEIVGISDKFNYKLVNFLEKEYEEQKNKLTEMTCKEYIACLILAVYNYENILKKRKMNGKEKWLCLF